MDIINREFINKGSVFTDEDFRLLLLAVEKYYEWNPIDVESDEATTIRDFTASKGFLYDFKKRHRISSRRAHYKRRPKPNEAQKRAWKKEIVQLLRNNPPENVLNSDETCWRLYPSGILTWAATGSENVAIEIPGDEKTSITAMATITADHQKLPLYLIAKGKTNRVEISQLGKIGIHQADHSPNGWQTVDTMKRYLKWLNKTCREDGTDGEISGNNSFYMDLDAGIATMASIIIVVFKPINDRVRSIFFSRFENLHADNVAMLPHYRSCSFNARSTPPDCSVVSS
jgi:hypothetical protein